MLDRRLYTPRLRWLCSLSLLMALVVLLMGCSLTTSVVEETATPVPDVPGEVPTSTPSQPPTEAVAPAATAAPTLLVIPTVVDLGILTPAPLTDAGQVDAEHEGSQAETPALPSAVPPVVEAQGACTVRADWPTYSVVPGDTLATIARRVGSTVDELAAANCLSDPDRIPVGLALHVPNVPAVDTSGAGGSSAAVEQFWVAPAVVSSGESVTFGWAVSGAVSVAIWRLDDRGRLTNPTLASGGPTGTATYVLPQYFGETVRFYLGAMDAGGTVVASSTASVQMVRLDSDDSDLPRILTFTASPDPVRTGETLTLSWAARDAHHVSITQHPANAAWYEGAEYLDLPLTGTLEVTLDEQYWETARFSLFLRRSDGETLTEPGTGSAIAEDLVVGVDDGVEVTFFTAAPDPVERGGTVTLNWDVPGATSVGIGRVLLDGRFGPTIATNLPPTGTLLHEVPEEYTREVTFYLSARKAGGYQGADALLTVRIGTPADVPQIMSFAAEPMIVEARGAVTLSWEVQGADHVTIYPWRSSEKYFEDRDGVSVGLTGMRTFFIADHHRDQTGFTLIAAGAEGRTSAADVVLQVRDVTGSSMEPQIVSFTAEPTTANPGDAITLRWEVSGSLGNITIFDGYEQRFSRRVGDNLPANGSIQYTIPTTYTHRVPFGLRAEGPNYAADGRYDAAGVEVTLNCPRSFFFGTDPADTAACPYNDVAAVQAAYQPFERGFMVWFATEAYPRDSAASAPFVFALYGGGGGDSLRDRWDGETITYDDTPPQGYYLPQCGFGKVWVEVQRVREGLGWATAPEQGYTMQVQWASTGPAANAGAAGAYFTLPDGRVAYVWPSYTTTWRFVE